MKLKEKRLLEKVRLLMKERRVALNYKQDEVALKTGLNIRTFRHFEQKGQISFYNLIKLFIAYNMDMKVISSITDRSWWTIEELERSEKQKTIRSSSKTTMRNEIFVIPIDNAKFGKFTIDKRYRVLSETTREENMQKKRAFLIKDDNGKEVLIADKYCKKIIENR